MKVNIPRIRCLRCGHTWTPRPTIEPEEGQGIPEDEVVIYTLIEVRQCANRGCKSAKFDLAPAEV